MSGHFKEDGGRKETSGGRSTAETRGARRVIEYEYEYEYDDTLGWPVVFVFPITTYDYDYDYD